MADEILKLISFAEISHARMVNYVVRLLAAGVLSMVAAMCYAVLQRKERETVTNLPYTMILFSVLVCGMMMVIGESVARAFGLVGALSVVRFRLNLRNPTDMAAILFTMTIGITCGINAPAIAVLFTFIVLVIFMGIHLFHKSKFNLMRALIVAGGDARNLKAFCKEIEQKFAAEVVINNPEGLGKSPLWHISVRFKSREQLHAWEEWLKLDDNLVYSVAKYEISIDLSKWGVSAPVSV
jgi:hypothetical protein